MQNVRSILLIDDDRDDFELVAEVLRGIDPGVSVTHIARCEDGPQYSGHHFDFILLDINMPFHDGFAWLKGIRDHGYKLPVIMYTNSSSPAHIVRAYEEGATLYFPKPDSYHSLVSGLKKLIGLDWTDPSGIKTMHIKNGEYRIFQVA